MKNQFANDKEFMLALVVQKRRISFGSTYMGESTKKDLIKT